MRKVNKQSEGYKSKAQLKKEKKEFKRKSQMEKKFLIGLYDDYRKDGVLNCVLNKINCNLIGSYSTEPIYTMYDVDGDTISCAVELSGINSIKVEVWEVNETTLDNLEKNYNYYPDFEEYPQDYRKEEVLSPYGKITMYFTNVVQSQENIIVDGDWIEYLNYVKVIGNKKENVL
jgi:gamma-glutamylcyclotransferase (GGCT)/AIG2-like uncharacterized protein YtfP